MDVRKLKCWLCEKEVPQHDLMYAYAHYKCGNNFLRELETLRVIEIILIEGTQIRYKFDDSFEKHLDKALDDARFHIITDEVVDEDLITMQGVLRAVVKYLQKETTTEKIYRCCELVFNSLMMQKYGHPLRLDKKFGYRFKEFAEEVYSVLIDEDTAKFLKPAKKWAM